jgi:hypothetical protein
LIRYHWLYASGTSISTWRDNLTALDTTGFTPVVLQFQPWRDNLTALDATGFTPVVLQFQPGATTSPHLIPLALRQWYFNFNLGLTT